MVLQPNTYNAGRLAYVLFGLLRVRSPLLAESLILFLFMRVLRCFRSPRSLLPAYEFSQEPHRHNSMSVSRFGDRRVNACIRLTVAYRSFTTSFIASWCQGIHRMLLLA
jgi:hypothetical protein